MVGCNSLLPMVRFLASAVINIIVGSLSVGLWSNWFTW
ncbi:unnamed protein product [Arabidopsis halleri]